MAVRWIIGIVAVLACGALVTGCSGGAASPDSSRSAEQSESQALPPVTAYALGDREVVPIDAASRAVKRALPIESGADTVWQPGSTQVAVAETPRGLTAYILEVGANVVPVNVATDTAGTPISLDVPSSSDAWADALAADPDGATVYVIVSRGNSKPGLVVPIDTATDTVGKVINVGVEPDVIAFAPDGKRAYVANAGDNTVTPINVATGAAGAPIPAPQAANAFDIVFTPDGRTAYVAGSEVTAINVATGTVAATIPVNASHLAITPDGATLYALGNSVTPISTATNIAGTPISVTGGEILMAPDGKTVYVIDQHGELTPIDVATGTAGAKVTDPGGYADDMAITPDGKTIWISDIEDDEIVPFATTAGTMGKPIKIAADPSLVAIVP